MKTLRFHDCGSDKWNDFCRQLANVSTRHSYEFLDYLSKSYAAENESVIALDDRNVPIAIVPLFFESCPTEDGGTTINQSAGGGASPLPIILGAPTASQYRKRFAEVYGYIDDVCKARGVSRSIFLSQSLPVFSGGRRELLAGVFEPLLAGYNPICFNSMNIDLRMTEENLMNNVSKFHRRHIRTALRDGQNVVAIDCKAGVRDIDAIFSEYQSAHIEAAGRMTRPQASFDSMRELIKIGRAALFVNRLGTEPMAYLFCGSWGRLAFGWSQANIERFVREQSPRHLLEWEAIRYYKTMGFDYYELGQRYCNGQTAFWAEQKLLNIATFKERYGGVSVPEIQFEKFYSQDKAKEFLSQRLNDFTTNFFSGSSESHFED